MAPFRLSKDNSRQPDLDRTVAVQPRSRQSILGTDVWVLAYEQ